MDRVRRGAMILLAAHFVGCASGGVSRELAQPGLHVDTALYPGDALRITVWRHPEFSGDFTVGADSALIHPLYQTVKVAGMPLAVARERLRSILVTYEQDVRLTVEPLWPVSVGGEVRAPNLYRLPLGTTVAQAVGLAGGPTDRGRLDRVRVVRRQGTLTLDLTLDQARAPGIAVASGDQVLVGRRSGFNFLREVLVPLASVTGAVAAIINVSRR